MKLDRTSMLYGTLILTGTSIVSQFLGFVYRILLSRLIGAEVMGLYQLIMPVFSVIMALTAVGLTVAVSNLSSQYHARGNRAAIAQVLRRCLAVFLLLFAAVAAVVVLLYDPISVYLLGDARTQLGLLLLLPCILLTGVENLHKHFFYGTGNIRPPAAVELCEQFIRTGAVLGLLVVFLPQNPERTVGLIVTGMILCELFSAVTLLLLARRHLNRAGGLTGAPLEHRQLNRRIASIAVPIGLTSLLGNLMGSATSVLIPQRLVHAGAEVSEAMSAFGVLCGMTLPMLCLPTAFIGALGLVLVPKLAEGARPGAAGSGAAPGGPLHAGHLGADPPPPWPFWWCWAPPWAPPCSGNPPWAALFSPCPSGCSCPATSPSSPAPSTAWAVRGPPPATPSSAAWCSSAVPSSSWACPAWGSRAMWRAFSPPPPWGYSSTGGPSAGRPACGPRFFSGAPPPPSPPCSWGW